MADTVHVQTYDGARNVILKLTNVSDGTGESAVVKLDPATLFPNPGAHLKIKRIRYSIHSGAVRLQWDATTPIDIAYLPENTNILDFSNQYAGGWPNDSGVGVTGKILLTTVGFMPNSGYTIDIEMIKGVELI